MNNKTKPNWTIQPAGDRSLVIVFESTDPIQANQQASAIARDFQLHKPVGVDAVVPGMVSVALHYAPEKVLLAAQTEQATTQWISPYTCLRQQLEQRLQQPSAVYAVAQREVEIPVCYGGEHGPDLAEVAQRCQRSIDEVIGLHTAHDVAVLMLGFAPGLPYIGRFSEQLSVGRRATPRTVVPAGMVGLANQQSVIYPVDLPGGWHLIGRTPLRLFNTGRAEPSLLAAGDRVRFVAITADEFDEITRAQGDVDEH